MREGEEQRVERERVDTFPSLPPSLPPTLLPSFLLPLHTFPRRCQPGAFNQQAEGKEEEGGQYGEDAVEVAAREVFAGGERGRENGREGGREGGSEGGLREVRGSDRRQRRKERERRRREERRGGKETRRRGKRVLQVDVGQRCKE